MMTPEEFRQRLLSLRLLVMDVDGTMTDGSLYYTEHGQAMKNFYVRDGMGVVLLHQAGLRTALLSSETSPILTARAKKLGIRHTFLGCIRKDETLQELCRLEHISLDDTAYIGDDINDISAMKIVGLSCCPCDAHPRVKQIAHYITPSPGGKGAIRDICDNILAVRNLCPETLWATTS